MKKMILFLLIILLSGSVAFADTALYRISSGEVYKISTTDNMFLEETALNEYYSVATSVTLIDGVETVDPSGNRRMLGYAKILDGSNVRNATQIEIDTFAPAVIDDRNDGEANQTKSYFENDAKMRRIMTAFASILVDEINILRAEHGLPDRTLQQFKTAILNRIDKDD